MGCACEGGGGCRACVCVREEGVGCNRSGIRIVLHTVTQYITVIQGLYSYTILVPRPSPRAREKVTDAPAMALRPIKLRLPPYTSAVHVSYDLQSFPPQNFPAV